MFDNQRCIFTIRGQDVLLDPEDYDRIIKYVWYYNKRRNEFNCSKTRIKLHRFIMCVTDPKIQVDHINGNKFDNRKENLRLVSNQENAQNLHKHKIKSSHGFFGVCQDKRENLKKRWIAGIKKDYKNIWLGRYETAKEAAQAYNRKAEELGYLTRNIL